MLKGGMLAVVTGLMSGAAQADFFQDYMIDPEYTAYYIQAGSSW